MMIDNCSVYSENGELITVWKGVTIADLPDIIDNSSSAIIASPLFPDAFNFSVSFRIVPYNNSKKTKDRVARFYGFHNWTEFRRPRMKKRRLKRLKHKGK